MRRVLNQKDGGEFSNACSPEKYYKELCRLYNEKEGNLHLEDGYYCEKCKNKGFIAEAILTGYGYWTKVENYCECQKIRKTMKQIQKSGLSNMLNKYRLDNYVIDETWQETIREEAFDYIDCIMDVNQANTDKPWYFIGGASGAGKTHICTAICGELLQAGIPVRYMLWRDDSVKLKSSIMDSELYSKEINELKNVTILYIDDLFKSGYMNSNKPSIADINLAFEIINYRYNIPELITIISSEYMPEKLENIDIGIAGRIYERAKPYVYNIHIDGKKNYRLRD